jgi:acyl dehydratase
MAPERAAVREGDALTERTFAITQEKINRYSRFALDGRDTPNIHTDATKAGLAGLPGPVAHGRHIASFFSEAMLSEFGAPWLHSGSLEVTLTKLVLPGDTLTLRSTVVAVVPVESGERVEVEMALVNQAGEMVLSGHAKVVRPGPPREGT